MTVGKNAHGTTVRVYRSASNRCRVSWKRLGPDTVQTIESQQFIDSSDEANLPPSGPVLRPHPVAVRKNHTRRTKEAENI